MVRNDRRRLWFTVQLGFTLVITICPDVKSKQPKEPEDTTTATTIEIGHMLAFTNFFTTGNLPQRDLTSIAHAIPRNGFITTEGIANTEYPDRELTAPPPVFAQDIPQTDFFTTNAISNTKFPTTVRDEKATEKTRLMTNPESKVMIPETEQKVYTTNSFVKLKFQTTSVREYDTEKQFTKPRESTSIANAIPYEGFISTNAITNTGPESTSAHNQPSTTNNTVPATKLYLQEIKTLGMIADDRPITAPTPMIHTIFATPSLMIAEVEAPHFEVEMSHSEGLLQNDSLSLLAKNGLELQHLSSLLNYILNNYDQRIRPREDQTRRITIFSDFVPQSIIEFDTQLQSFSVMGYFKTDWRDDFLKWNPSDYDETETLRIPAQSVWIPKLVVNKGQDGHGVVGSRDTDIVLINYKGYVRWFPEGIYSVVCQVTIKFYPFDVQNCTFSYYIADEDNTTINLKHYGDVDLSEYIENAEWKLVELTAKREENDQIYFITFHFKVERRGGFAMFTLIVPVLMLSVLGGATFLIPIESGEKCSFSVTIFLAFGIFETIVIDTLPHNSLDVSYFIIYLTSMLIVSTLLTFYTILQAKIFDSFGDKEFRLLSCGRHGHDITWGKILQKLDNYVFVAFLIFVVGCTSTILSVLSAHIDFL